MIAAQWVDIVVPLVVGAVGIVAFAGVMWVRFKGGALDELRASLLTANQEIQIANARSERLEASIAADAQQIKELRDRVQSLESENAILRAAIASGTNLAPEFGQRIVEALHNHEEHSQAIYSERLAQQLKASEERIANQIESALRASEDRMRTAVAEGVKDLEERIMKEAANSVAAVLKGTPS
jgi:chromosome segregation ATPase